MSGYNLHILRHAQSASNVKGVVQGQSDDSCLSESGKEYLSQKIQDKILSNINIRLFFSSDAKRALTTAKEIAQSLNVPVQEDSLLREVDAGIIAGKNKTYIRENHPLELEIWERYGDLDGIQDAETGKQLQARVIAFLIKLQETQIAGNYGVVSHAAFIRSLVNTISGSARETLTEYRHLELITCEDAFSKLSPAKIGMTFTSAVYHVATFDHDYVVKRIDDANLGKMQEFDRLIDHLSLDGLQNPNIFSTYYNHNGRSFGLVVSDYISGSTLLEKRTDADFSEICTLIQKIFFSMGRYKEREFKPFSSLEEMVAKAERNLRHDRIGERRFLNSDSVSNLFNISASRCLVDHDCHYGNFIRSREGMLHKIDVSPLIAPEIYQSASLLLSAFMLGDPEDTSVIDKFLCQWDNLQRRREDLIVGMKLRACMGISYFDLFQKDHGYNEDAKKISENYRKCFITLDRI